MPPISTRLFGPYKHNGGWRCQLEVNGHRKWAPMGETPQRAEQRAQFVIDQIHTANPITVQDAIDHYREHLTSKGNKPDSIENTLAKMRRFFAPVTHTPIVRVTKPRAATLYDDLRTLPSERTGKPLAADSHRNMLAEAKTFLSWCVEQKWLGSNPLASVKGIGKRRHGKPQLRIDEARKLRTLCHEYAQAGESGPVAVLMGLLMGMRAGEIVNRTARDLDDDGHLLWLPDSKTEAGKRAVEVPEELQPYLRERTTGKAPDALIFQAKRNGKHWRDWVAEETRRLCRLAKVPIVCAHSLRGFAATAAIRAGGAPHMVAAALGHVSPTTTLTSYATSGSVEHAQQRQALDLLGAPARQPALAPN